MATRKDSRRTGLWPLAYMGVEPVSPPLLLTDNRAPTVNDYKNFNVGTWWINRATAPSEEVWILVNKDANVARWIQFATGLGLRTLTGDVGAAVPGDPVGQNIDINAAGGTPYEFVGYPASYALELRDDGTIAYDYDCDVGTATPAANILEVLGGTRCSTTGAGNVITIDVDASNLADSFITDAGTAIPNAAGELNVLGGTRCSTTGAGNTVTVNVDVSNLAASFVTDAGTATPDALGVLNDLGGELINTAGAGNTVTTNLDRGTDGQVIIGATGLPSAYANITSAGATITITNGPNTINLESAATGGGTKITTFTSSGTWTKDANAQNIEFYVWNGGSGGGSGRRGASTAAGGGSGGSVGGNYFFVGPADRFPASASVVVGSGGAGGVLQTVDNTDGNSGSIATYTTFLFVDFPPANGPLGGTGGDFNGATSTAPIRGPRYNQWNSSRGTSANEIGPKSGNGGVAAGGTANHLGTDFSSTGGPCRYNFAGAAGGGAGADAVTERQGGAGSDIVTTSGTVQIYAPAAGGLESTGIDGADGADASSISLGIPCGGLGGGGGGGQSVGGVAGDGGDGGAPGGAGGGGGGSLNGTNSGAGGPGGRGEVVIIEYLG